MFAYFLLGETMGPTGFAGGLVIAIAVYMVASTTFNEENTTSNNDISELITEANAPIRLGLSNKSDEKCNASKESSSKNEAMTRR